MSAFTGLRASGPVAVLGVGRARPGAEPDPFAKQRKTMSQSAWLAALAVRDGLSDAGISDGAGVGLFLGVGASGGSMVDVERIVRASTVDGAWSGAAFATKGVAACNPLLAFQLMNSFTLAHAAIAHGTTGPNAALFSRGGGTTAALVEAMFALQEGSAIAIAGGADDALHPVTLDELAREGTLPRVPAEGAAVLVLGSDLRGARAYLEEAALVPLDEATRGEAPDRVLVADVFGGLAEAAVKAWPGVAIVDRTEAADALAATPAGLWAEALAGLVGRTVVLTRGRDGAVARVGFSAVMRSRPARPTGSRRAVITGVGAVTAFGIGAAALFTGLREGRGAVGPITSFDASGLPSRVAGEVPVATPDEEGLRTRLGAHEGLVDHVAPGGLRDRKVAWALLAAAEAWASAGCPADPALVVALGLERAFLEDFVSPGVAVRGGPVRFRSPVDLAARAIADGLGLSAPPIVNASACAAGALAVAHAAALVERGTPVVLCGGADSMVNPLGMAGMARLGAPSPRASADACRPFDVHRDGMVIGEGAGMLVVEDEDHARARGAVILARVAGWGSTQDAWQPTAPRADGRLAAEAMSAALRRAGLSAEAVGYVNAHGTGTPTNDVAEARALHLALGRRASEVPVSSIKGAIGHLMAASGAVELAACLMCFSEGLLPGTMNFRTRDPRVELDVIGEAPRSASVDCVLSNSFGFGGQNAAVLLCC